MTRAFSARNLTLPLFTALLLLTAVATLPVGSAAVALQLYKGHAPVEILLHLKTCALILLPSAALLVAAVITGLALYGGAAHKSSRGSACKFFIMETGRVVRFNMR